jgi:hypothetical protein
MKLPKILRGGVKKVLPTESPETRDLKELAKKMKNWYADRQPYVLPFHDDPMDNNESRRLQPLSKQAIEILELLKKSGFGRRELQQAWSLTKLPEEDFFAFDQWQYEARGIYDPVGFKEYKERNFSLDYKNAGTKRL